MSSGPFKNVIYKMFSYIRTLTEDMVTFRATSSQEDWR